MVSKELAFDSVDPELIKDNSAKVIFDRVATAGHLRNRFGTRVQMIVRPDGVEYILGDSPRDLNKTQERADRRAQSRLSGIKPRI